MLRASVVVCTYNRERCLADCLRSVARQDLGPDAYEIIVVDNNSKDGTAGVAARFREGCPVPCAYVLETQQGLSRARNRGIREARAPVVVFIDDDAIAEPDWLRLLLVPLEDPAVVAVGGGIRWTLPDPLPEWVSAETFARYAIPGDAPIPATPDSWPIGANMAFRRTALAGPQPFDPDLGRKGEVLLSSEETALFQQLAAAGGVVMLQPRALVEHVIPAERLSFEAHLQLNFGHGATKALLLLKEDPRRRRRLQLKALASTGLSYLAYAVARALLAPAIWRRRLVKVHRYRGMMAGAGLLPLDPR